MIDEYDNNFWISLGHGQAASVSQEVHQALLTKIDYLDY